MSRTRHYLTPDGKRDLERELSYLLTRLRPWAHETLWRRSQEGVSDNPGYAEAKHELDMIEVRIRWLRAVLADAEVLETQGGAVVKVGSIVTVAERGHLPETYLIVDSLEASPAEGRISNESPIGKALMGHSAGEHVEAKTPGGTLHFEILHVE